MAFEPPTFPAIRDDAIGTLQPEQRIHYETARLAQQDAEFLIWQTSIRYFQGLAGRLLNNPNLRLSTMNEIHAQWLAERATRKANTPIGYQPRMTATGQLVPQPVYIEKI